MTRLGTRILVALVDDLCRPVNHILDRLDARYGPCRFANETDDFCADCPDREACATGYPCTLVRRAAR